MLSTRTRRPGCALRHRTSREWGSTQWALMKSSKKSRYLGNCQHTSSGGPRFPVWLRSYCFGSLLIAAASLDGLAHRWQEFMLNHRKLKSSQEAAMLKTCSRGFNAPNSWNTHVINDRSDFIRALSQVLLDEFRRRAPPWGKHSCQKQRIMGIKLSEWFIQITLIHTKRCSRRGLNEHVYYDRTTGSHCETSQYGSVWNRSEQQVCSAHHIHSHQHHVIRLLWLFQLPLQCLLFCYLCVSV